METKTEILEALMRKKASKLNISFNPTGNTCTAIKYYGKELSKEEESETYKIAEYFKASAIAFLPIGEKLNEDSERVIEDH